MKHEEQKKWGGRGQIVKRGVKNKIRK